MLPLNKLNLPKNIITSIQNWQAKKGFACLVLVFTILLSSCEDPTSIGSNLDLGLNALTTTYADTFTVRASTMRVDSVITASPSNLLVGQYEDPIFGTVAAQTNFQVSLPANAYGTVTTFKLDDTAVYDSLYMTFLTPAIIQGDTTKPLRISVHRLTEDLSTTKNYLNDATVAFNPNPMATKNVVLKRYANVDTVKIRLSDDFGKELFALSGKDDATTNEKFKAILKGFVIKNNGQNSAILALSATSGVTALRLYYHKAAETTAGAFGFPLAKEARFNKISSTFASRLQPKQDLGLQTKVYLQNGVGIATKLTMPYIKNLVKLDKIAINKAELVIETDSLPGFSYPRQVILAELETNNAFARTSNLVTYLPVEGAATVQAVPYISKKYTFNITSYLYEWLREKRNPKGFALLAGTYDGSSLTLNDNVSRSVIQAKNIKLKVYYSSTKK